MRGDRWRVESGRVFSECQLVRLAGIGRVNRGRRLALLHPFDRFERLGRSGHLRVARWPQWLHALRALVAATAPYGRLRAAWAANIDLHPYQLEPALAVVNGLATRLLLADEVGLGKTIQAGLIVSELLAREQAARTLILTPAGLRDQWASELRERFSIEAAVVDAAMVRWTVAQVAAGTNPWSVWPVIISSLDFVKRAEVLRALDPFTWDVLLVDEAHLCAMAPERSAAVRTLAARARLVVLLTATPHAGDDEAFAALCGIGQLERGRVPQTTNDFRPTTRDARPTTNDIDQRLATQTSDQQLTTNDQLVMFRRTRTDVGLVRDRRVHLFRVRCTDDERRMHRLLERYTRAVWASADAGTDARLAMIVLRKRALSSASSLARSLQRRLEALFDAPASGSQLALPFAGSAEPEDQTPEDDEPIAYLAAPAMEGRREREWLNRLLEAASRAAGHQSKIARLSRLLIRARQPAVIFTEYRDTARWLAASLRALGPVVLLHGGLSRAERLDTERAFRSGAADVLVATDAAGEGLNLQHRCRLVVNLELPWNPMRLEQRIGRVDRLGQRRRPHAIHLVASGTAEERIVRRLVFRQERARRSVGSVTDAVGAARQEDVAEAVMSGEIRELPASGFGPQSCGLESGARGPSDAAAFSTVDVRDMAMDEARRLKSVRAVAGEVFGRRAIAPASAAHAMGCTAAARPRRGSRATEASEGGGDAASGPLFSTLPPRRARRSRLPRGLLCLFIVRLQYRDEGATDESLVAVHVSLTRPPADLGRSVLGLLASSEVLRQRALADASERLKAADMAHARATLTARAREQALAAAERHPAAPVQPGMFDHRALQDADRERAARTARESEESERLSRLDGSASSPVVQAQLALVLAVDR